MRAVVRSVWLHICHGQFGTQLPAGCMLWSSCLFFGVVSEMGEVKIRDDGRPLSKSSSSDPQSEALRFSDDSGVGCDAGWCL